MEGKIFKLSREAKYLGVVLDSKLAWHTPQTFLEKKHGVDDEERNENIKLEENSLLRTCTTLKIS